MNVESSTFNLINVVKELFIALTNVNKLNYIVKSNIFRHIYICLQN